jgi:HlyD family secretion protein
MTPSWKRMGMVAAVAAVVGGGIVLLRPSRVVVETARVSHGPLQVTVDAEGQTRVRDRYVVAAPVAGRLARVTLREGDSVIPQEVVAQVYPEPLDPRALDEARGRLNSAADAQRAAAAAVAQARAALEQARRTRRRTEELATNRLIAPEERERAELDEITRAREVESADFRAQAAAHDVEVARAALYSGGHAVTLRSPVRGSVLRVLEQSERVVTPGTPLVELGDPHKLEIVTDLLSSDAVQVKPGDVMLVEGWGGGTLRARVRVVEPSGFTKISALGVEEQRVNVIADFADSLVPLGDRYRVEVRIVIWESGNVLRIPGSALFRHGDAWSVFVVAGGRARRRDVTVGHRNAFDAEILGGVSEGDIVIRYPSDQIADGVRVTAAPRAR